MNVELLKELGIDAAADKVGKKLDLKRKMTLAYEHYRFVEPHIFDRFQAQLKKKTLKQGQWSETYDKLKFTPLAKYTEVPPMDCLMDLKKAKEMRIFDTFEVAKVETVEERKDPIIFGSIEGCPDKFFITQWDDDVKIEDILNANEG